jgi:hypothetical protein
VLFFSSGEEGISGLEIEGARPCLEDRLDDIVELPAVPLDFILLRRDAMTLLPSFELFEVSRRK